MRWILVESIAGINFIVGIGDQGILVGATDSANIMLVVWYHDVVSLLFVLGMSSNRTVLSAYWKWAEDIGGGDWVGLLPGNGVQQDCMLGIDDGLFLEVVWDANDK